MLSELIAVAQREFAQYGDMPVCTYSTEPQYDYNVVHDKPVSEAPESTNIGNCAWRRSYWPDAKFERAFKIVAC